MSKANMTCDDCKENTKPDEFACECLCIDCGPCKDKCKPDMKEELFGQKEIEELKESYKESRRQAKERTTGPLDSFSKDLKDIINKKYNRQGRP